MNPYSPYSYAIIFLRNTKLGNQDTSGNSLAQPSKRLSIGASRKSDLFGERRRGFPDPILEPIFVVHRGQEQTRMNKQSTGVLSREIGGKSKSGQDKWEGVKVGKTKNKRIIPRPLVDTELRAEKPAETFSPLRDCGSLSSKDHLNMKYGRREMAKKDSRWNFPKESGWNFMVIITATKSRGPMETKAYREENGMGS